MTAVEPRGVTAPDEHPDDLDLEHWGLGTNTSTGLSNNKLAMWLFLGSDCLLFGGLISTYLLYRHRGSGIQPEDIFDIPFTSVSSFVLLMSSMAMVFAVSAITRGDHPKTRLWLVVTAMLGGTFVAGQVYEFTTFYREGLGYTTNLFSSAFYTLTGFHGVHVTVGIVMLMSLFVMSVRGRLPQERAETVEIVGLYWHFVDIVWVLIFTIVYLIPEDSERMSTATKHTPAHAAPDDHHDDHPKDKTYWVVGAVLGIITALEVSTYFITDDPYSHDLKPLLIGSLLVMMVLKFVIIVAYFMHAKFDNPIFRRLFIAGLVLAVAVYVAVFTAFQYWTPEYEDVLRAL